MPKSRVGKGLTAVRGPVHGNFAEGAKITQGVIGLLTGASQWNRLSAAKKEAIHMIVHKIHRIVTGNPEHKDHWDDIGGYAQLGADDCPVPVALNALSLKSRRVKRQKAAKPRAAKTVVARPAKKAAKKAKARKRHAVVARGTPVVNGRRRPRAARTSPALVPEVA
jgi:hypothetical protein